MSRTHLPRQRKDAARSKGTPARPSPGVAAAMRPVAGRSTLRIGAPNAPEEAEADRIADQAMRQAAPSEERPGPEPARPRQASAKAVADDGEIERRLRASRGGGTPVPPEARAAVEARTRQDLGAVRIHADDEAAALNAQLGSRAFAYGRDIYFGADQYRPGVPDGDRLLAHELTHAAQQRRGGAPLVQRERLEFPARVVTSTAASRAHLRRQLQAYRERVALMAHQRAQTEFNNVVDATSQFRAFAVRRIAARAPAINGADLFFAALAAISSRIPGSGVAVELAKQIYRAQTSTPSPSAQLSVAVDQLVADVRTKTNNAALAIQRNVRTNPAWERIIADAWSQTDTPTTDAACTALGLGPLSDYRAEILESLMMAFYHLEVAIHPNRAMIRSMGSMLYNDPMGGYRIDARRDARRIYGRTR